MLENAFKDPLPLQWYHLRHIHGSPTNSDNNRQPHCFLFRSTFPTRHEPSQNIFLHSLYLLHTDSCAINASTRAQGTHPHQRQNCVIVGPTTAPQKDNAAYSIAPRMKIDLIYHYGSEKCCNLAKIQGLFIAVSTPQRIHHLVPRWSASCSCPHGSHQLERFSDVDVTLY